MCVRGQERQAPAYYFSSPLYDTYLATYPCPVPPPRARPHRELDMSISTASTSGQSQRGDSITFFVFSEARKRQLYAVEAEAKHEARSEPHWAPLNPRETLFLFLFLFLRWLYSYEYWWVALHHRAAADNTQQRCLAPLARPVAARQPFPYS